MQDHERDSRMHPELLLALAEDLSELVRGNDDVGDFEAVLEMSCGSKNRFRIRISSDDQARSRNPTAFLAPSNARRTIS